jgi:hypothetical protein
MSRFALLLAEQEASCYLPDKEFRYLRHVVTPQPELSGWVVSVPPSSPRRRGGRTISSPRPGASGVWPLRIPATSSARRPFLLIACTGRIVTHQSSLPRGQDGSAGTARYSGVPAYSQILQPPNS